LRTGNNREDISLAGAEDQKYKMVGKGLWSGIINRYASCGNGQHSLEELDGQ
jgi:hypothetical protein